MIDPMRPEIQLRAQEIAFRSLIQALGIAPDPKAAAQSAYRLATAAAATEGEAVSTALLQCLERLFAPPQSDA